MTRLLAALVALGLGCGGASSTPDAPTVAAAASLRAVMPALIAAWGAEATVTYGASGTLRRQVESGAPIDIVVFAAAAPVDSLAAQGLVREGTRVRLATNELVLVRPKTGDSAVTWKTLTDLPADAKLAIGEPAAAPAGRYAVEALRALGSWDALQDRLVYGGDVTSVLAYARRGEVAVAVIYATDAQGQADVVVLDRATWDGAPRPEVVAAAVSDAPGGRDLLAFLATPTARSVFARHGFGPP